MLGRVNSGAIFLRVNSGAIFLSPAASSHRWCGPSRSSWFRREPPVIEDDSGESTGVLPRFE